MSDFGSADEPTRVNPTVGVPGYAPPPPEEPPPTDYRPWIIGGVVALIALVAILLLALGGDDDKVVTDATVTTSTTLATTTTAEATTTTGEATTTTAAAPTTAAPTTAAPTTASTAPPATVAPGLCRSSAPDDPDTTAQTVFQAFTLGDRNCASRLMTPEALEQLFDIPGAGGGWSFAGCSEVEVPDPAVDCAFVFEGGSTHFRMNFGAVDGWKVFEVFQVAD